MISGAGISALTPQWYRGLAPWTYAAEISPWNNCDYSVEGPFREIITKSILPTKTYVLVQIVLRTPVVGL